MARLAASAKAEPHKASPSVDSETPRMARPNNRVFSRVDGQAEGKKDNNASDDPIRTLSSTGAQPLVDLTGAHRTLPEPIQSGSTATGKTIENLDRETKPPVSRATPYTHNTQSRLGNSQTYTTAAASAQPSSFIDTQTPSLCNEERSHDVRSSSQRTDSNVPRQTPCALYPQPPSTSSTTTRTQPPNPANREDYDRDTSKAQEPAGRISAPDHHPEGDCSLTLAIAGALIYGAWHVVQKLLR